VQVHDEEQEEDEEEDKEEEFSQHPPCVMACQQAVIAVVPIVKS